jgi:cobalt-zinc-cadmium efflux system membrane fusion protein
MNNLLIYCLLLVLLVISNLSFSSNEHDHHEDHAESIRLTDALIQKSGITLAVAGPGIIQVQRKVYGRLMINPEYQAHIKARFPGKVESVYVTKGTTVKQGDLLAKIESDESLRNYSVTAPLSGIVIERNINPGEQTDNNILFVIANPTQLVAELSLFSQDLKGVTLGQAVTIKTGTQTYQGSINSLTPGNGTSITARVMLQNQIENSIPNQTIEALITVEKKQVEIKIDNKALQEMNGKSFVFVQEGNNFEARLIEPGLTYGQFTEIKQGVKAGDTYVIDNSYLLKADLEKSGAAHEH